MSSSKDTIGLFGDAKIFEIKNSDDEGSSNKVTKKRKLRRLVKASDAGAKAKKKKTPTLEGVEKQVEEPVPIEVERGDDPSKATSPIIEEVEASMPESLVPEAGPATERHPEWFKPIEASLEKKNVEDTDGSSSYTAAAAIYHFGDNKIECPIIEEVAATLTEEESLKMVIFSSRVMSSRRSRAAPVNVSCLLQLTTAMASILMREKMLKRDIVSLQTERGFLEQERQSSEASRKEEEALRLAREQELAGVQAMYKELEAKLNEVKALGGHGVAVAALERMESGKTINAGWLQQFIRPHPKKTLHEALKKGVQQLSDGQLPLFRLLCGTVPEMKSSTEISSFKWEVLTVLPDDAGEEVRVPELAPDFIGVEVEREEDSSEGPVEDDGQSNPEPEGTSVPPSAEETNENQPTPSQGQKEDSYFLHHLHLLILEEEEVTQFPLYAMISSILRKSGDVHNTSKQEEEWKRRLHQYDLDFHASLSLEANIYEEMDKLKSENSQLRRREKIVISPWFLEKLDTLALVESQIKIRTERFIAAIDLLKKRTKEVEFYSKQAAILQNILVDNEISLPILDDLDPEGEAQVRAAAEEYLLRINDQD
ncbi:OLC1v1035236C1 [Oldenlandia corymbosa var. corymbosa]|uniref:OLC1v1035236C1 n=1 Tax=Oldenlandia corymbosa var. corymbosa TaxID=529605 RepID=A0AAV1CT87_OLDCO|nr:OLC1v1035236C1 [Oldenlandia corymbosa var. corymbosa]